MIRTDCFAYCKRNFLDSEYEDCEILKHLYCRDKDKECKFFKTKEEYIKGNEVKNYY